MRTGAGRGRLGGGVAGMMRLCGWCCFLNFWHLGYLLWILMDL